MFKLLVALTIFVSSASHAATNVFWTPQARSIITSFRATDYNPTGSNSNGTAFLQLISTARTRTLANIPDSYIYESGDFTQVALDPDNELTRQCVTLVKILTNAKGLAAGGTYGSWIKGRQVTKTASIIMGNAVATFGSDGKYNNKHTAIFMGFEPNVSQPSYITVFDQN